MLKIILTGPESSGKTTLSERLSRHYNTPLVVEYAREFFEKKQTPQYEQSDLELIAQGQIESENFKSQANPPILICDTDILTIKIWSEVKYGNCSPNLTQLIDNQCKNSDSSYKTHYFLCSPKGIEWEYDPLRENPNDREKLFKVYENELKNNAKTYDILRGGIEERLSSAISIIEKMKKGD